MTKDKLNDIEWMTRLLAGTALSAAALMAPASAFAQDAATGAETAAPVQEGLLADIVVTAQKKSRAEQVQKVPIAITAVSAAQIDALKIVTLKDIGALAPNVALTPNGSVKGVANFTIRGLGANSSVASLEPTVGTFINGIYQGVNGGVVLESFDLEGIEVLRGPQGTLFGRNVTGGAVLVRTARPTDSFQAALRASLETGPQYTVAGSIGGPIIGDNLLAKVTGYYKNDKGWFHNRTTGEDNGKDETWFVRPTIVFKSGDGFTQTLIAEHLETKGDGIVTRNIYANPEKFQITSNNRGFVDIRATSITSETTVETPFGDGVITNLAGYRELFTNNSADLDSTANSILDSLGKVKQHQFSNELRYAGNFFDRWDLTVGLYFFSQDIRTVDRRSLGPPLAPAGTFTTGGGHIAQQSFAAFTQSDIELTDTLTATLGLRYSFESKDAQISRASTAKPCDFVAMTCNYSAADALVADHDWNALTPKVGLRWQATPQVMLYGSFSQGIRSGGYNLKRSSAADPGFYDQEDQDSFELGVKSDLFDHTVRANLTGFFNKVHNMQRDSNFPGPTGPIQILSNSVDAEIYGFEGELVVQPVRGLQLNANFGYTHGKYSKVRLDLSGDGVVDDRDYALKIPRLSPWTYNVGATYSTDVGLGSIDAHVDYGFRSGAFGNESNTTILVPYRNLNASLTFSTADDRYSVSLYGKNLTNHEQNGASLPIVLNQAYYYTIEKGRQLGIELNARF